MNNSVIETNNLTRRFDKNPAVDSLSMTVAEGSVVGFLGVNGAGKTTTIRMLAGHLHPSAGSVKVLGRDPRNHPESVKREVAYVSENMNVPAHLTPPKAVAFNSRFYPEWDGKLAETLLTDFDLNNSQPYKRLSKGQKRRLCILLALCQRPQLLIMDEPAAGLDVMARHDFLARVLDIACTNQCTVFFSSHILTDLERIADRILIIDRGKLMVDGCLEDLKAGVRKIQFHTDVPRQALEEHFKVIQYAQSAPGQTQATIMDFDRQRFSTLCQKENCAETTRVFALNLEDIFVEIVRDGNTDSRIVKGKTQ